MSCAYVQYLSPVWTHVATRVPYNWAKGGVWDWISQCSVREEVQTYETPSFPAVLYAITVDRGGRKGGEERERRKVMKAEGGLVEDRGRITRVRGKQERIIRLTGTMIKIHHVHVWSIYIIYMYEDISEIHYYVYLKWVHSKKHFLKEVQRG